MNPRDCRRYWVVAIPFLIYLLHALVFRGWIVDDAGISFVYARNLAQGYGLVSQPGNVPVEGFSNFTWVLLLVPFFWMRLFDPIITPKVISGLLVLASFVLVYKTLALSSRHPGPVALVSLSLLAINSSFVIWTTSGLENPLYVCLICALCYGTVTAAEHPLNQIKGLALLLGGLAALTAMTRPDGIVFAAVFPFFLLLTAIRQRPAASKAMLLTGGSYLLAFLLLYGGFLACRRLYFGDWLPNTYYAKGGPSLQSLEALILLRASVLAKLLGLLAGIAGEFALWSLAGVLGATFYLIGARAYGKAQLILLLFLVASASAYYLLPDDWMAEFRFATPFFVFAYIYAISVGASALARLGLRPRWKLPATILAALSLIGASATLYAGRTIQFASNPTLSFTTVAQAYAFRYNDWATRLDLQGASVLLPDIGGTLYYSKLKVYDLGGLTDKTIARTMGHDQQALYNYVFDTLKPTFIHTWGGWDIKAFLEHDPRFRRDYVAILEFPDDWVKQTIGDTRYSGDYVRRDAVRSHLPVLYKLRVENGLAGSSYEDLLKAMGYVLPAVPSPNDLMNLTPIDVDIGGVAIVSGYELSTDTIRPGDTLTVTLYWRPQATTDRPYTVFVHLYDPVAGSLAQTDGYPLGGQYETTAWVPGRPFVDTYVLKLPKTATAVRGARVVFGLYDLQTMQRLPVTDGQTGVVSPESWGAVGQIDVVR